MKIYVLSKSETGEIIGVYSNNQLAVDKAEALRARDNLQEIKWKAHNSHGWCLTGVIKNQLAGTLYQTAFYIERFVLDEG